MDQLTIREALPVFYKNYNLKPDGGFSDNAVKVEYFKGFYLYLPNFAARKSVLLKHDIHHIITGYKAVMKGETEISAWEISTGCTHNWFAFAINTMGAVMGLPFNIKGIWKAWVRGRSTKNLYHSKYKTEELLNKKVLDLKRELGLLGEINPSNQFPIAVSFIGFMGFGLIFAILSSLLIPIVIIYSLAVAILKSWKKP